jgi:hypothetical protein
MAYAALNATSLASAEAKSSVDYSNVDDACFSTERVVCKATHPDST